MINFLDFEGGRESEASERDDERDITVRKSGNFPSPISSFENIFKKRKLRKFLNYELKFKISKHTKSSHLIFRSMNFKFVTFSREI